jgi:transcriptional regulator with XRE-family HTH domain
MTTLAKRIKKARRAAGLTQNALATTVGTSQPVIWSLEAGHIEYSKYLPAIAKATKTTLDWLVFGEHQSSNIPAPSAKPTAIQKLCEEQQAKIEALLADNAILAEAKGKLAEELEALRDENIALAKEAIGVATSLNAEQFQSFVADIRSMLRVAFVTGNHSVTVEDLQALINHHTL